jgi:outer membrane protein assembly factor BamA
MPISKLILWMTLALAVAEPLLAQDPPPPLDQTQNATEGERIVEGRPAGYSLKRVLHPITWVDAGVFRPAYRLGTSPLVDRLLRSQGRVPIGIGGAGPGSGFGPQVSPLQHAFFGRAIEIETPVLYTYKNYQAYQLSVRIPAGPSYFFVGGGYRSRPEDRFFGIGNETSLDNDSFFKTTHREAAAGFSGAVTPNLRATLQLGFENVGVTKPQSGSDVSAQDQFSQAGVPALATGATMRSTSLLIDHNTKDDEHRATRGGLEYAEVGLHESVSHGDFAYWKYHLEFQRFFAVSEDRRSVISVRGMAETNQEKGGSLVPFFDMPWIGSWRTLRGFENYRYRDKSALAVGIEYRYRIWRALDWAFFVDNGQVGPEPGDFSWSGFHTGYGARLIMLPTPKFPVTVDVGRSNEQWRMYINFNPTF